MLESRRSKCSFSYSYSLLFEGSVQQHPPPCQSKKQVTHSAEVPVLHTPVEVRFSMTCHFVHGQGKRGNAHIPAIMSVAFPDVVVFDGFI